jgi:hypothetical protein
MMHLTALQCSLYVDEALPVQEAEILRSHIDGCPDCGKLIAGYVQEKHQISAALQVEDLSLVPEIVVPKFTKPIGLREFALANVITGVVLWLAQFLWKTLFGELIMSALSWFSLPIPDAYEVLVDVALYFSLEGGTMFDSYFIYVVLALFVVLGWSAYSYRKARGMEMLSVIGLLGVVTFAPTPVQALDFRRDENMVKISASEVIDDTLVVASDTVIVDADIGGDLIVFGRRVVVNGDVSGNLVTFARTIVVEGKIGGSIVTAGDSVDLVASQVGGGFWAAAGHINVDEDSEVNRNAMMASELITVAGRVGKDLYAAAETTEISGRVGEDVEAFTHRLNLLDDARVEGSVRLHTDNDEALQLSDSAVVVGEIENLALPKDFRRSNRYASGEFYLHQSVRLVSAFLVGLVLLWMIPAFRGAQLEGGIDGVATAGIGLVALISLPVIGLLVGLTVIGLPFTVIGVFAWIMIIYFAKIVIAPFIGQLILSSSDKRDSIPFTLFAGLLVIILVINLPGIGGFFNFLLTIIGIGVIVRMILSYTSELRARQY